MSKGKRPTCKECKWYSEKGGPIGSCLNTGYRLELEDFCRPSGCGPMMIKGPQTWVPTWCHKFWERGTDSNEQTNQKEAQ